MRVTREVHVAACTSSKETETEKRRSANEVRETGGSSFTQWCWTTQWEYPTRTERQRDQGPRSGTASQKVSSEPADQVVVNYRTGARTSDYAVAEYYAAVLEWGPTATTL